MMKSKKSSFGDAVMMKSNPILLLFVLTLNVYCLIPSFAFVVGPSFLPGSKSLFLTAPQICLQATTSDTQVENTKNTPTTKTFDPNDLRPELGSIVTVALHLVPNDDFIPEPLIDTEGNVTFVLGGGNFIPGLHEMVAGMMVGARSEGIILDAGWGSRNPDLVISLEKERISPEMLSQIQEGTQLMLQTVQATVTKITDTHIVVDANPPLAGSSYTADIELLKVESPPEQVDEYVPEKEENHYQVATFALGCFWGSELAFMRLPGVVGTKVGYTQGQKTEPTYREVCSGSTGHTEANFITFDSRIISYQRLVEFAMERLGDNVYLENQVGNDRGTQYRHGIYYHNDEQKDVALQVLERFGSRCKTECLPATTFWDAEDYHQQYLLKGGQSARKNEETPIRCYG